MGEPEQPNNAAEEATSLLARIRDGDDAAVGELLPLVYGELRARAEAYFRHQPGDHTLQPTALVHEAYLRLVKTPGGGWNSRAHFCAVAATAMRQILVSHARHRKVADRDMEARKDAATWIRTPSANGSVDLLDLEDALERLREVDPDGVRLVELRFFGGLSIEETADVLGSSATGVKRAWRGVRAWLLRELGEDIA